MPKCTGIVTNLETSGAHVIVHCRSWHEIWSEDSQNLKRARIQADCFLETLQLPKHASCVTQQHCALTRTNHECLASVCVWLWHALLNAVMTPFLVPLLLLLQLCSHELVCRRQFGQDLLMYGVRLLKLACYTLNTSHFRSAVHIKHIEQPRDRKRLVFDLVLFMGIGKSRVGVRWGTRRHHRN